MSWPAPDLLLRETFGHCRHLLLGDVAIVVPQVEERKDVFYNCTDIQFIENSQRLLFQLHLLFEFDYEE